MSDYKFPYVCVLKAQEEARFVQELEEIQAFNREQIAKACSIPISKEERIRNFTHLYTSSGPGRHKPEFIIIDDMEDDAIDTTASEISKELEHHDHRD